MRAIFLLLSNTSRTRVTKFVVAGRRRGKDSMATGGKRGPYKRWLRAENPDEEIPDRTRYRYKSARVNTKPCTCKLHVVYTVAYRYE